MNDKFKIGDLVSWNSEAGRVSGTLVRVHRCNFDVSGYTHHASVERRNTRSKTALTKVRD